MILLRKETTKIAFVYASPDKEAAKLTIESPEWESIEEKILTEGLTLPSGEVIKVGEYMHTVDGIIQRYTPPTDLNIETNDETDVAFFKESIRAQADALVSIVFQNRVQIIEGAKTNIALPFGEDPEHPLMTIVFEPEGTAILVNNAVIMKYLSEKWADYKEETIRLNLLEMQAYVLASLEDVGVENIGMMFAFNKEFRTNKDYISGVNLPGEVLTEETTEEDLRRVMRKLISAYLFSEEFFVRRLEIPEEVMLGLV